LLEALLRAAPSAPVLVVSAGAGLAALLDSPDRGWLRELRRRPHAAWLTPVDDARLWPAAFDALGLLVWPMTRAGLAMAARQLAGLDRESADVEWRRVVRQTRETKEDVERHKRLASVVPHPSPVLLDQLRYRFAPDVSDAAVLQLLNTTGGAARSTVHLPNADLQRAVQEMRRETPDLEHGVRAYLLDVLRDSEPADGTAAHERWRIAVASQQLQLADLRGDTRGADNALAALRDLASGPMHHEVDEILRLMPAGSSSPERLGALTAAQQAAKAPAGERERQLIAIRPPRWSWPGLRELLPASVAAALIVAAALLLNVLPARAVDHVLDAYGLAYSPVPSLATPRLTLTRTSSSAPPRVDLFKDRALFRSGIDLSGGTPVAVALTSNDTGANYQVRGTLPEGNLAVSPWVWVTSDKLVFLSVDAAPWADVRISGGGVHIDAQQTPFTTALLPGTYQFHFQNSGLGPAAVVDRSVTIPDLGPTLHVTMPGFDPASAVDSLLRPAAAAKY
jgi:hypothetical protein